MICKITATSPYDEKRFKINYADSLIAKGAPNEQRSFYEKPRCYLGFVQPIAAMLINAIYFPLERFCTVVLSTLQISRPVA